MVFHNTMLAEVCIQRQWPVAHPANILGKIDLPPRVLNVVKVVINFYPCLPRQ